MRKKGFTLIELMVVIAIIAILAAIALQSYRAYMRKAKAKELLTFARACVQESVAQCISNDAFADFEDLDACQVPANLPRYLEDMEITPPENCDDFTTTVTGTIDGVEYEVTCDYDEDRDDIVCSAPRRTGGGGGGGA